MFQPKSYLEGKVLRPGTYSLRLLRWDRTVAADGQARFLLEFEVAEDPERTLIEWWGEGNEVAIRRAIQLSGLIKPEARNETYPSVGAFFEVIVKELMRLAEEGRWLRAVVVVGTRADGTPVARIRQFLGVTEVKAKRDTVPF